MNHPRYVKPAQPAAPNSGNSAKAGKSELILPSANVSFTDCANVVFPNLAKTGKYFVRDRTVVELVSSVSGYRLVELEAAAFRSRLEHYFEIKKWVVVRGKLALTPTQCSADTALALLKTEAAITTLPTIRIVIQSPVFREVNGEIQVLGKGFHNVEGGIFVLQNRKIEDIPVSEAKDSLLELLKDFDFVSRVRSQPRRSKFHLASPALRRAYRQGFSVRHRRG